MTADSDYAYLFITLSTPPRQKTWMKITARTYSCGECRCLVTICSSCDRGNTYCQACAIIARERFIREAKARYQSTSRGRLLHADRQARYRTRQKEKVTDQGYSPQRPNALLKKVLLRQEAVIKTEVMCDFCGCHCSKYVRQRFINHERAPPPYDLTVFMSSKAH
jgi:hypothetical protein